MSDQHQHNHNHMHDPSGNIKIAFFLNLSFTIAEIIGGFWTNSIAILSDALHDLGDSFSLGFYKNIHRKCPIKLLPLDIPGFLY